MKQDSDRMLYEQDVVEVVCKILDQHGYKLDKVCTISERGFDIIASQTSPRRIRLYVEVKGETSSRVNSKRYGKPFNIGQVRIHVAVALYKSAEALSLPKEDFEVRAAIALPNNQKHRDIIERIAPALYQWDIGIFWVDGNGRVEFDSPWEL